MGVKAKLILPKDYYTTHYNPRNNITSILPPTCPLAGRMAARLALRQGTTVNNKNKI